MHEADDQRKTLSARRSKSPLNLTLPENTKGPANLISLPDKEELDVICPDEIFRMVNERK